MTTILNLTQHDATGDQIDAGVVEPSDAHKDLIGDLLTIKMTQPDGLGFAQLDPENQKMELERCAHDLAVLACEYQAAAIRRMVEQTLDADLTDFQFAQNLEQAREMRVMVGGFQPLMDVLVDALKRRGMIPVVALSEREVVETTDGDGNVSKRAVFKHCGFYAL